ncbi:MAG: pyruvate kinase [Chloroflexi bacterium]|nr:pyruvate kinase [Chloroflexota bacterium]
MVSRKTKIVATLGPASRSEEQIAALIGAGVDIVRLNFSHGTHDDHGEVITRVRRVAERLGRPVGIMQDLQGPKIRVGKLAGGQPVQLENGTTLTITTRDVVGSGALVSTTYQGLPSDVKAGDRILLDDGNLELRVEAVRADEVTTTVIQGGLLGEHKGINLPGVDVSAPALSQKDRDDLAFGLQNGVDYVAMSFVRRGEDVLGAKSLIRALCGADVPVIAKLEKPQALDNLRDILEAADGVMVARGDLGVELSPQEVPIAQKRIIAAANMRGRLVITATQMLESMIENPRPTRAEASDVANAIFDGTDAVMLSGETATGAFPVQAVSMMATIAMEAERNLDRWGRWRDNSVVTSDDARAIASAAVELSLERDVKAILAFTRSGRTARLLSKERPACPIYAFSPDAVVVRRMALMWGVYPRQTPFVSTSEAMFETADETVLAHGLAERGDPVVFVGSMPVIDGGHTNFLKLHRIGES